MFNNIVYNNWNGVDFGENEIPTFSINNISSSKSSVKSKIKRMTEDTFMEGGKVIYEVYTFPSFESDYEEFTDLESALEYLGKN